MFDTKPRVLAVLLALGVGALPLTGCSSTTADSTTADQGDSSSGGEEGGVVGAWRRAEALRRPGPTQSDDYWAALEEVVSAYGEPDRTEDPDSLEYAAHAAFLLADRGMPEYEGMRLSLEEHHPANPRELTSALLNEKERGLAAGMELVARYDDVFGYGSPAWQVAALAREGHVFDVLVEGLVGMSIPLPTEIASQLLAIPESEREEIQSAAESRVRADALVPMIRPLECQAVLKYVEALRIVRTARIDTEFSQHVIAQLSSHGEERIAECLAAQANELNIADFQPGELRDSPVIE